MGLGLFLLTLIHVAISLVGIGSGVVVAYGLLTCRTSKRWTAVFLWTTVATSVTGFLFPFERLLPSHVVGILSLVILAIVIVGREVFHLAGAWRRVYAAGAVLALYLNVFVLVVQLFQKTPLLRALAPTQTEPPFVITQAAVLVFALVVTVLAAVKFRVEPAALPAVRTKKDLYMQANG
jgi:hypothetical protein